MVQRWQLWYRHWKWPVHIGRVPKSPGKTLVWWNPQTMRCIWIPEGRFRWLWKCGVKLLIQKKKKHKQILTIGETFCRKKKVTIYYMVQHWKNIYRLLSSTAMILKTLCVNSFNPHTKFTRWVLVFPHFTDKATQAHRIGSFVQCHTASEW